MKLNPLKGRPLLHWIGKRPPLVADYFPCQLRERYGAKEAHATPSFVNLQRQWHNLLLHGDNKEILSSLLVQGFRGKVDLIYIDPPFASAANYERKTALRGSNTKESIETEGYSLGEIVQYEDIWANDTYLQYMYERLILLRELLSDHGSIYLHCDWHKSHHLRMLLDEVFGAENFVNENIWHYKRWTSPSNNFQAMHDTVYWYAKNKNERLYNKIWVTPANEVHGRKENYQPDEDGRLFRWQTANGERYKIYRNENGVQADDVWDISFLHPSSSERTNYPTQKPESLIERIIKASSNEGDLVLDCFCGSGTTAAVAEKLGRRWIMADINRGAIQTTINRLLADVQNQPTLESRQTLGFAYYKVNNYDFLEQNDLRNLVIEKYGIEKLTSDSFFDGVLNGNLIKFAPLNRPLAPADIDQLKAELDKRPDEDRNITLVGNGQVPELTSMIDARLAGQINAIQIIDIARDGFSTHEAATADIDFARTGSTIHITVKNYISPTILARREKDRTVFGEDIPEFRAQIDCVMIDTDYKQDCFQPCKIDNPKKKSDFVEAIYTLDLPHNDAVVAVKITDVLGEEIITVNSVS